MYVDAGLKKKNREVKRRQRVPIKENTREKRKKRRFLKLDGRVARNI